MDSVFELNTILTDFFFSDGGALKSPTIMGDSSISPFSFITFILTYFHAPLLHIGVLNFVMSS